MAATRALLLAPAGSAGASALARRGLGGLGRERLVFLWVLFIAVPAVLIGQLIVTFLVRARGTVRHSRALSWWDVLVFAVWHGLIIATGFYPAGAFWPLLFAATAAFLGVFWVSLWQLFREARPVSLFRMPMDSAFLDGGRARREPDSTEVFVVEEAPHRER